MAKNRTVQRAASLFVAVCGVVLYAGQVGWLSWAEPGARASRDLTASAAAFPEPAVAPVGGAVVLTGASEPQGTTPQAAGHVADPFARLQVPLVPSGSGFAERPDIAAAATLPRLPAASLSAAAPQPASFSPALPPLRPSVRPAQATQARELSPLGLPCGLDITAEAMDAGMIALGVAAPCEPETAVTISHSGLTFAMRTDAVGLLTLDLPAVESPARIAVRLPDGTERVTRVSVPDLSGFDRLALTSRRDLGLLLHALNADAAWMSQGHIRPDAPHRPGDGSGFLTRLGDPDAGSPMVAQVVTLPRGADATVSIDAPITEANCGRRAEATLMQSGGSGTAEMMPLRFTYPGCEAVGDTLVLQNLLQDLRLAAN